MIKVAVIGSRTFDGIENIELTLDQELSRYQVVSLISGGAMGVDRAVKHYALKRGYPFHEILAKWSQFGRAAGPIRNKQVVEMADHIIAFWDGKSKGTKSVLEYAQKLGKPLQVFLSHDQSQAS